MTMTIVLYSNDPETVWNAFRFGNFAMTHGDDVTFFLIGKGVECRSLDLGPFTVTQMIADFIEAGGKVLACSTCLELRGMGCPSGFAAATLKELHELVAQADRVCSF
ncbi:MAG: DsrE family protein [Acidobacteriota bacterium]